MTTTNKVVFSIGDVELLFSIPQPGGDLAIIVRTFTFLNRSVAPRFSLVQECFTKALQTGILSVSGDRYQIAPDWYQRIHKYDDTAANEIESMLEFEDEFVGEEVPIVESVQIDFTEEGYGEVVRDVQRRFA